MFSFSEVRPHKQSDGQVQIFCKNLQYHGLTNFEECPQKVWISIGFLVEPVEIISYNKKIPSGVWQKIFRLSNEIFCPLTPLSVRG